MSHDVKEYYDILGVGPDATQKEIKEAFRQRAFECHPDRVDADEKEAAEEEFLRVREAFDVLSDAEKKKRYDRNGAPDSENSSTRRRRSYKEEWKKYRHQKVHVGKDIVDNVGGLSSEYDVIQQKTSITIPVCSLFGVLAFVYDPLMMYGTGVYLLDVFLCGLIGSVYGFAIGSLWGYIDLFLRDLGYK